MFEDKTEKTDKAGTPAEAAKDRAAIEAHRKATAEIDAVAVVQKALLPLDVEARVRITRAVIGYFDIQLAPPKPKQTRVRAPRTAATA